jgi:hypothetical protein
MRTQSMANSCPNYLDAPSHKLLAYLLKLGLLTQFGHSSKGDRSNCGSSESRGSCVVSPKSEQQITTLNQK